MEVFASLRFGGAGAKSEARQLQEALGRHGVQLHIVAPDAGANITKLVFSTMERCSAMIVFGTSTYGEDTGNAASTAKELAYWQNTVMTEDPSKKLILLKMLRQDPLEKFAEIETKVLFGTNQAYLLWEVGSPLHDGVTKQILKTLGVEARSNAGGNSIDGVQGVEDTWPASSWKSDGDPLALCGRRVRILWPKGCSRMQANGSRHTAGSKGDQWWAGRITAHNPTAGRYRVTYDDGDIELLELGAAPWCARYQLAVASEADVGRRLKVTWRADTPRLMMDGKKQRVKKDSVFAGTLVKLKGHRFAEGTPQNYFVSDAAYVRYDDGDEEMVDLCAERFEWE